jgi:hypothetical protein
MSAPLKAIDGNADLPVLMTGLATHARAAARVLALASPEQKNDALEAMERAIRANAALILAANAEDVVEVRAGGASPAFIDRLTLTQARIDAMAARRRRRDLRKPSQCRRRRRRAVPEIRKRGDPARRFGQFPVLPRDP